MGHCIIPTRFPRGGGVKTRRRCCLITWSLPPHAYSMQAKKYLAPGYWGEKQITTLISALAVSSLDVPNEYVRLVGQQSVFPRAFVRRGGRGLRGKLSIARIVGFVVRQLRPRRAHSPRLCRLPAGRAHPCMVYPYRAARYVGRRRSKSPTGSGVFYLVASRMGSMGVVRGAGWARMYIGMYYTQVNSAHWALSSIHLGLATRTPRQSYGAPCPHAVSTGIGRRPKAAWPHLSVLSSIGTDRRSHPSSEGTQLPRTGRPG